MKSRINIHLYTIAILFILSGCAQETVPTGGKKDVIPPQITKISPTDSGLNIRPKKLDISFNEYITVNDASNEIQISPLLEVPLTTVAGNKKITIKIPDTLLEANTTYRISLGNSIKDLHEGNLLPRYTYTFSTGNYFDSLQLKGKVINAATGLADTGKIGLMLYYKSAGDSAILKQKPKYYSTTNADGTFTIKGLPNRAFTIYAIKDVNDNKIYDINEDMIAFTNETILPSGDTMSGNIATLRLFKAISTQPDSTITTTETKPRTRAVENKRTGALSFNIDTTQPTKRTFDITQNIELYFSDSLLVNFNKITLQYERNDSTIVAAYKSDIKNKKITLVTDWKENTTYHLLLAKGYAKDSSGKELTPCKLNFKTKEANDYGKLKMMVPSKYVGDTYIFEVVKDKDTIYHKTITDSAIQLSMLKPGKYLVKIIEDKNKNGIWDTGDLLKKEQPEYIYPFKDPINVRAGWDNTIDFEPKNKRDRK